MDGANDLISFVASMAGEGNLRVEENFGEGFVRLRVSEAERRQAKHDIQHVEDIVIEMLRNARDAGAKRIYVATGKDDGIRTLLFIDDGAGVPLDMQDRIFDARVTSKLESMKMDAWGVHGRGMALYSIRQNALEARVVTSQVDLGSSFLVRVDCAQLPERADQSTWPTAERQEDGIYRCVRGPHNIVRAVGEFALDAQRTCDVFIGSPTEIAATLVDHAAHALDRSQVLFLDDVSTLPVPQRLGCAADAVGLVAACKGIGLDISERTAHRILGGSFSPLSSVFSRLVRTREPHVKLSGSVDLARDRRGLRLSKEDVERFSRSLERDFDDLARRYYVTPAGEPRIRVLHDRIVVTFPLRKDGE